MPYHSALSQNISVKIHRPYLMKCFKTGSLIHGTGAVSTIPTTSALTGAGAVKRMPVRNSFSVILFAGPAISVTKSVTALNLNSAGASSGLPLSVTGAVNQETNVLSHLNMITMPSLPTACTLNA